MNILNWLGIGKKKRGKSHSKIVTRRADVYTLYFKDGMRQEEIAKRLRVGVRTIERDISHLKKTSNKNKIFSFNKEDQVGFKDLSKEQIKEIHRLVNSGKIYEDVAKIVGTSKGVIGYVVNKNKQHKKYISRKYIKEHRVDILRRSHNKKTPEYYHEMCPACNESSQLTIDQWVELQKYVRVNRIQNKEFSLSAFLTKRDIVLSATSISNINKWKPESALRVLDAPDGVREFVPVTAKEMLQREPSKEPKGGFILSDDY